MQWPPLHVWMWYLKCIYMYRDWVYHHFPLALFGNPRIEVDSHMSLVVFMFSSHALPILCSLFEGSEETLLFTFQFLRHIWPFDFLHDHIYSLSSAGQNFCFSQFLRSICYWIFVDGNPCTGSAFLSFLWNYDLYVYSLHSGCLTHKNRLLLFVLDLFVLTQPCIEAKIQSLSFILYCNSHLQCIMTVRSCK